MKKLSAQSSFYQIEARVLIAENDDNINGLVSYLLEKISIKKDKLNTLRSEMDVIIHDPDIEIPNEAKEKLMEISSQIYNILLTT